MSGPSDFRERLTLLEPVETPDGQGGVVRTHAGAAKIWARVLPRGGRPGVEADADGSSTRLRIEARAPLALTLAHRLVHGAKTYRITGFRDDSRIVTIDAVLRVE